MKQNEIDLLTANDGIVIDHMNAFTKEKSFYEIWKGVNMRHNIGKDELKTVIAKLVSEGYISAVQRQTGGYNYIVNDEERKLVAYQRSRHVVSQVYRKMNLNPRVLFATILGLLLLLVMLKYL